MRCATPCVNVTPGDQAPPSIVSSIATPDQPFVTDGGDAIAHVELAYETWGKLNAARDNAILVFHALTGDAHAASHPEIADDRLGWWEPLIGPGRPIDTDRYFVVCANALGSCYGSTGPCTTAPDGIRWNARFPAITVRDLSTPTCVCWTNLALTNSRAPSAARSAGWKQSSLRLQHQSGSSAPSSLPRQAASTLRASLTTNSSAERLCSTHAGMVVTTTMPAVPGTALPWHAWSGCSRSSLTSR